MKFIKLTLLVTLVALMNSCASGYKEINPQSINYSSRYVNDGVKLEYKYNVLGKGKYSKYEKKKDVRVVAVKLTNNTNEPIVFGKDVVLTNGNDHELYLMKNEKVYKSLKQSPASHLLYLLLVFVKFQTYNGDGSVASSTPVGLVVGPVIAGGNMLRASSSNNSFKKELKAYNLEGKIIQPGKSEVGLIGIQSDGYDAIKLRVNKKSTSQENTQVKEQSITTPENKN